MQPPAYRPANTASDRIRARLVANNTRFHALVDIAGQSRAQVVPVQHIQQFTHNVDSGGRVGIGGSLQLHTGDNDGGSPLAASFASGVAGGGSPRLGRSRGAKTSIVSPAETALA